MPLTTGSLSDKAKRAAIVRRKIIAESASKLRRSERTRRRDAERRDAAERKRIIDRARKERSEAAEAARSKAIANVNEAVKEGRKEAAAKAGEAKHRRAHDVEAAAITNGDPDSAIVAEESGKFFGENYLDLDLIIRELELGAIDDFPEVPAPFLSVTDYVGFVGISVYEENIGTEEDPDWRPVFFNHSNSQFFQPDYSPMLNPVRMYGGCFYLRANSEEWVGGNNPFGTQFSADVDAWQSFAGLLSEWLEGAGGEGEGVSLEMLRAEWAKVRRWRVSAGRKP